MNTETEQELPLDDELSNILIKYMKKINDEDCRQNISKDLFGYISQNVPEMLEYTKRFDFDFKENDVVIGFCSNERPSDEDDVFMTISIKG